MKARAHPARRRAVMDQEIKGKAEKAKGFVKEKAGQVTDNRDLEAEGKIDRASGAVRETAGKAKRKVKEGIENVSDAAEDLADD
jgi:uncharacterized protein YjbJ (UPF0337 family)